MASKNVKVQAPAKKAVSKANVGAKTAKKVVTKPQVKTAASKNPSAARAKAKVSKK